MAGNQQRSGTGRPPSSNVVQRGALPRPYAEHTEIVLCAATAADGDYRWMDRRGGRSAPPRPAPTGGAAGQQRSTHAAGLLQWWELPSVNHAIIGVTLKLFPVFWIVVCHNGDPFHYAYCIYCSRRWSWLLLMVLLMMLLKMTLTIWWS